MIPNGPELTSSQFGKLAAIIHADSGIVLNDAKKSLLMARLNRRLRTLQLSDYGAYCSYLDGADGPEERRHLLSAITTNVTAFFREEHHFHALTAEVLPPLISIARQGGRVRLWSAACSSGEEPYSMAMTLLELFPEAGRHDVLILATDIDPVIVERARAGRFGAEEVKALDERRRQKFFNRQGDVYIARDELRQLIRFAELNLHEAWTFSGRFDVIFCRNVAIYFDGDARRRLWHRFAALLPPQGELFIGHSERIDGPAGPLFDIAGATRYRRNTQQDTSSPMQGTNRCR
ncbi:MAG: CheR family methyltransferase [Paracoccus sp. (in: a-proteobacteria)]